MMGNGGAGGWWLIAVPMMVICMVLMMRMMGHGMGHGVDHGNGTHLAAPGPRQAEEILAERLARGDIDTEEYARRLDALRTSGEGNAPSDERRLI